MANIPTIPGTAQIRDQNIGVRRNLGAEEAPFEAARGAIKSATNAGEDIVGSIAQYEQRKQNAEDVAAFNQAFITMNTTTQSFRDNLKRQPYDQIVPNWSETASGTKSALLDNSKLSPQAKIKLSQQLDSWQGQTTAEFQTASDVMGTQAREGTAVAAMNAALKTGDPAMVKNAGAILDATVKAGDMPKWRADGYKAKFPEALQRGQAGTLMLSNPSAAYEALGDPKQFPAINNPLERETLRNHALTAWNHDKIQTANDIRVQQTKGKIWTQQELDGLVQAKKLDATTASTILKQQAGKVTPDEAEANRSKVQDMILDIPDNATAHDRLTDVTKIHMSHEFASLPEAVKHDFDEALKQKTSPDAASNQGAVVKQNLLYMKQNFETGMSFLPTQVPGGTKRVQEMPQDKFEEAFGKGASRTEIVENARLDYAKRQAQFLAWTKDPKNKDKLTDPEAVQSARRQIEQPATDEAVKTGLGVAQAKPAQFVKGKTYKDAKGNKATWNGTGWDEVK